VTESTRMTNFGPQVGSTYFDLSRNGSCVTAKRGDLPTVEVGRLLVATSRALEAVLDSTIPDVGGVR
jgi:hypothetical protein